MRGLIKHTKLMYLVLLIGAANAGGGAGIGDIEVTRAWSRATPPGLEVAAAYFVITNQGASDRLVRVSSPAAGRAEFHMTRAAGGVMKMERLDAVDIKSGSTPFAPHGRHVMLTGLKQPLKEGDVFPLTLVFEKAGSLDVQVHVKGLTETGEGGQRRDHPPDKHSH